MAGGSNFEFEAAAEELATPAAPASDQPWPSRKLAWYALTLLTLATMMNSSTSPCSG